MDSLVDTRRYVATLGDADTETTYPFSVERKGESITLTLNLDMLETGEGGDPEIFADTLGYFDGATRTGEITWSLTPKVAAYLAEHFGRWREWRISAAKFHDIPHIVERRPDNVIEEDIHISLQLAEPDREFTGTARLDLKSSTGNDLYLAWCSIIQTESQSPVPCVWFRSIVGPGLGPPTLRQIKGHTMDGARIDAPTYAKLISQVLALPPEAITSFDIIWVLAH